VIAYEVLVRGLGRFMSFWCETTRIEDLAQVGNIITNSRNINTRLIADGYGYVREKHSRRLKLLSLSVVSSTNWKA